jgi:Polyketide cyclase / dehydrase and lipid transport
MTDAAEHRTVVEQGRVAGSRTRAIRARSDSGYFPASAKENEMTKVQETRILRRSADEVWAVIGGFDALPQWHPAVKGSTLEGDGRIRRLQLASGALLVERLQAFSEAERSYTYSIEHGPLPVARYRSLLRVHEQPGGESCRVEWSGEFLPEGASEPEAIDVIRGIYRAGLEQLGQRFGH